jgi:hypothetical protein
VVLQQQQPAEGDGPVVKKLSLVVALVLFAGSFAKADDSIDLKGISDANNAVIEANVNVDFDSLSKDKNDQAVEACFRGYGGCYGYNYGCYNYGCYNYCYNYYPCYSYYYTPCYYVYRPVCYTYAYSYPLYTWGCW